VRLSGSVPAVSDKLEAALPVPARVTPELAATLLDKAHAATINSGCSITWISYAGDEGGIMCRLSFGDETANAVFYLNHSLAF
jgi:hypothetical protein